MYNETELHFAVENQLMGMIADFCRVKKDDKVIFYLLQNNYQGISEGKFFGIFKIDSFVFLDNNDKQFLAEKLKNLLHLELQ